MTAFKLSLPSNMCEQEIDKPSSVHKELIDRKATPQLCFITILCRPKVCYSDSVVTLHPESLSAHLYQCSKCNCF